VGYRLGDTYTGGAQGSIATDYSADTPLTFTLNNDLNITETNTATVLAYTDLGTAEKLYDRHKIEWRNNDGYAIVSRVGKQLDPSAINLTLDATAASVYAANTTDITAKTAIYAGGLKNAIGSLTIVNGTLLAGGTFEGDFNYYNSTDTTITNVIVTSGNTMIFNAAATHTIDGGSIANVTSSAAGVILNLINGATVTTNGSPSNITISTITSFEVTGLIAGSEVRVYEEGTTKCMKKVQQQKLMV